MILSLSSLSFGQNQNHLILKKGYKNRLHFLTGDSIRFLSERSEKPIIGYLQAIGEDFVVVNDEQFPIKEINTIIYRRKSFNFVSTGKILQIAGPGFLVISGFNALLWSIRPIWSTGNLVTSGSLLGLGLILPKFQQRNFEIGKKFFLRIVPSDPETIRKEITNSSLL
jgi:hypothetical protein